MKIYRYKMTKAAGYLHMCCQQLYENFLYLRLLTVKFSFIRSVDLQSLLVYSTEIKFEELICIFIKFYAVLLCCALPGLAAWPCYVL